MIKEIPVKTTLRIQLIDVTSEVEKAVKESGVKGEGVCLAFATHTTAAVTINENADPDVKSDILKKLNEMVPENANYAHSEGNSDAHIKSSLIGCSELIPISNGSLVLGTWQGIIFCEFDGPRNRKLLIQTIESPK